MTNRISELREKAIQTERLALAISDFDAGRTLKAIAKQYEDEADVLEAKRAKPED